MPTSALFAYNKNLATSRLLPGRPQLFEKLRDRGLRPLVSLGAEGAFQDNAVDAWEIAEHAGSVTSRSVGALTLHDEVQVVINRADKSLAVADMPPVINENATRVLGGKKWQAYQQILEPLGIGISTALPGSPEDIERFIDRNNIGRAVAKPQTGNFSKGVQALEAHELAGAFADNPDRYGSYVLQPYVDLTVPFPSEMRAYDAASHEAFDIGNAEGENKELRMYGFCSPSQTEVFPVARAIVDGVDGWFFVDPDGLDAHVTEDARKAISLAAEVSGAQAVYGSVDYVYGSSDSSEPTWKVMEMNLRMPYLLGYDKHAGVADKLHEMFADQITDTAQLAQ